MSLSFRNTILSSLSSRELIALGPLMEKVTLDEGRVIEAPRLGIENVWFLEEGLASVFIGAEGCKSIGVGMVGNEGFVGASLLNGVRHTLTETIVQIPGNAWRIDADHFSSILSSYPELEIACRGFHQALVWQMARTALSNARGHIEQRLARWLLMCQDRVGGAHIRITHDDLAAILGVRRPGVTDAIHVLEGEGFIRSTRIHMQILARQQLEKFAGGFYGEAERIEQARAGHKASGKIQPQRLQG